MRRSRVRSPSAPPILLASMIYRQGARVRALAYLTSRQLNLRPFRAVLGLQSGSYEYFWQRAAFDPERLPVLCVFRITLSLIWSHKLLVFNRGWT